MKKEEKKTKSANVGVSVKVTASYFPVGHPENTSNVKKEKKNG